MPRGNDADFARLHLDHAHLGEEAEAPRLRHDQQFAIGIEEIARPSCRKLTT